MKKAKAKTEKAKAEENASTNLLETLTNLSIKTLTYANTAFLALLPLLFFYLNQFQPHYFIDEKFHIPQTQLYCDSEFDKWDPKITTLPGLYLFSALLLGPLKLCTITNLRFINVLCTYLNFFLTLKLVSALSKRNKSGEASLKNYRLYLTAWNITFFPPLFFWFFLYYTDIFSVTFILLMLLLHVYNRNKTAAFVGALSIIIRQTNVMWVAFVGIERGLTLIEDLTKKPQLTDTLNLVPCVKTLYNIFKAKAKQGVFSFLKFVIEVSQPVLPYLAVLISFVIFIFWNGGIVVGDKTAHVPTLHVVQIFYYSVFVLGFSWPYLLPCFTHFFKFVRNNLILSILIITMMTGIVHYNTLVHPYILADNRHYSFYIWKNLMNRYAFFKYLPVPIYAFATFSIVKSLNHLRLLSILVYVFCVSVVLIPQLLLEPRYFIIPYVLFRLYQRDLKNWQIIAETVTCIFVNIAQFVIFTRKSFYWDDELYPQRISW